MYKLLKKISLIVEGFSAFMIAECGFLLRGRLSGVQGIIPYAFIAAGFYFLATTFVELDWLDKKVVVYMDIDGCLATWFADATMEQLQTQEYYEQLPPHWNLVLAVKQMQKLLDVTGLGKYFNTPAQKGKRIFLRNVGLGDMPVIFVPYEDDKSNYIKFRPDTINVLVDDYTPNLFEWESHPSGRNVAVKFRNGINGTKGTWGNRPSVRYDDPPEKIVQTILRAAYERR